MSPSSTAGDSLAVSAWTAVSRATGVGRVVAIGAVLGPTWFGNTYQFANTLPNLVFYGFLAGSLLSSLLVPALVRHLASERPGAGDRLAGGLLGAAMLGLLLVSPVMLFLGPWLLRVSSSGGSADQQHLGRLLVLMVLPQVFCYAAVATCIAVLNSRRRFRIAAAGPALENVGVVTVMLLVAMVYGTSRGAGEVPTGELLLLGLGSTAAVLLHAALQWCAVRRLGVVLRPAAGWRDPEVRMVLRRALPSLAQAALVAVQLLVMLVLANRVAGGVVAFQVALNFFFLPIAVFATPVALTLLPRLARLHQRQERQLLRDRLVKGYAVVLFLSVPAAVGYVALAPQLAQSVSFGQMSSKLGTTLVAASLAAVAAGVVGQGAFVVATYASYACEDTLSPLASMCLQTLVALPCMAAALLVHGTAVVVVVGLAYSLGSLVGAIHLTTGLLRRLGPGVDGLGRPLVRACAGAVLMAGPVVVVARWADGLGPGRGPAMTAVLVAASAGVLVFLSVAQVLRSPELAWAARAVPALRRLTATSQP